MARDASSSEVAARLGISPATIQRYARDGRIPFSETPGGHRRFDIEEVQSALASTGDTADTAERQEATAVILTALGVEFEAVARHLPDRTVHRLSNGTRYHVGSVKGDRIDWTVAVAEVGEGNLTAAAEATRAIDHFEPDVMLFVGIAGSLKADVGHGAVVVASKVYRYHSGKAAEDFLSRPMTFPTWHGLEQLVRHVRQTAWAETDPKPLVELKPIAAGEVVVASKDSDTFRMIYERCNDAVAVDMESAGMYEAAHRAGGLATLAVRGISDMLDDKTPKGDAERQPLAAKHAAAFAFALLRAAHPRDLGISSSSNPFSTERSELLGNIPPSAAAPMERALTRQPAEALRILRKMADRHREPVVTAQELAAELSDDLLPRQLSADIVIAIGEFAAAHSAADATAIAFQSIANAQPERAYYWLARAALAVSAAGESAEATRLMSDARVSAPDNDPNFIDVLQAAIDEDAEGVLRAAQLYGPGDGLVDFLQIKALARLGRTDEAIALAYRSLADHPTPALTGGLALETARLLLLRTQQPGPGLDTLTDLDRARQLSLQVRDLRRQWRGPSEEASVVAAAAAGRARDFHAALRIAEPPPHGDAIEREACYDELKIVAANAALAAGLLDRVERLAAAISDTTEALLVRAERAQLARVDATTITPLLHAALASATNHHQRFRAYMSLASLGVWPLAGLDDLERDDYDAAESVRATADIVAGRVEEGIRRLRALRTERASELLVGAYVQSGRIEDAVSELRSAAERFNRPPLRLQAAVLLASSGRYEESLAEASSALLAVPPASHLHGQLRRLCLELESRQRHWSAAVHHAQVALAEGQVDAQIKWALVGALFNLRELAAARRTFLEMGLEPRDDEEARLAIELIRTGPAGPDEVARLLDLADQFPGSEPVTASAFMAIMDLTRDLVLPQSTADRIRELTDTYFSRWPESTFIKRLDASDPKKLIDFLQDHSAPLPPAVRAIELEVKLGRKPFAMICALWGRPLGEALITRALGCLPAGTTDVTATQAERRAALATFEKTVVVDTHALYLVGHTGLPPAKMLSRFAKILVPRQALDDALGTARSLRVPASAKVGWEAVENRPYLIKVDEDTAQTWRKESEDLVDRVQQCQVTDGVAVGQRDDPRTELVLSAIYLARQQGCPLWSDDPAIREIARNEGILTFSTLAMLEAMRDSGELSDEQLDECQFVLMQNGVVDIPFRIDLATRLAEEEGWVGIMGALTLTRPTVWLSPEPALALYRQCVQKCHDVRLECLANWSYSAGVGLGRAIHAEQRPKALASLVFSGFFPAGSDPQALRPLLQGARLASRELDLADPLSDLARLVRDGVLQAVGPLDAPSVFAQIVSGLDETDRLMALEELLRDAS